MKKALLIGCVILGTVFQLPAQVRSKGQSLLFQPEENRTRVQAGIQFRDEDDALNRAEGKGLLQGEVRLDSRHSLDSLRRVQGHASYQRGVKRSVYGNTSSDWDMLAPYITLDTVGGDLQKEQYRFAARYAARTKGRFFYSLMADFRALHEFRQVDPRPRNITSDLQVSAQAGFLTGEYALSLEAAYRKYHQSNDTEFMSPKGNNTSIIHYLGFGRYTTRFSGAKKSTQVRFHGNGFGLEGKLEPVDGKGWIAGGRFRWMQIERNLPGYNETPISELLNCSLNIYGGKKWQDAYLTVEADWALRRGTENLIDQTSAFNKIGGLNLYRQNNWGVSVQGCKTWNSRWYLLPELCYRGFLAQGLYPASEMGWHFAEVAADGGYSRKLGAWHFAWNVHLLSAVGLGNRLLLADEGMDERLKENIVHYYTRGSGSYGQLGADFQVARELKGGLSIYARPAFAYTHYFAGSHRRTDACLAIGVNF